MRPHGVWVVIAPYNFPFALAGGPPDPKVKPALQAALDQYAPTLAKRAQANPVIRANALLPAARFGLREEMKQDYGFGWRQYVRGVTSTLDVGEDLHPTRPRFCSSMDTAS